jgi:hypothetical protein
MNKTNKYEKDFEQLMLCAIQHASFMEYKEKDIFRTVSGKTIGKPNYLALLGISDLVEMTKNIPKVLEALKEIELMPNAENNTYRFNLIRSLLNVGNLYE